MKMDSGTLWSIEIVIIVAVSLGTVVGAASIVEINDSVRSQVIFCLVTVHQHIGKVVRYAWTSVSVGYCHIVSGFLCRENNYRAVSTLDGLLVKQQISVRTIPSEGLVVINIG